MRGDWITPLLAVLLLAAFLGWLLNVMLPHLFLMSVWAGGWR